ncbi:MAG: hypothetical protein JSR90_16380 [Proteobacteria bacterium]|nr:hypothetical protein [Pseudomonadota bacterium]
MIERLSAFWRRRLRAEVRLADGHSLYVARYVDAVFDAATVPTCIGRVFATYLQDAHGAPLDSAALERLTLEDRKAAFAAIVGDHSQVQGVAIRPARERRAVMTAIRAADSDAMLEDLARRFIERHAEVNRALLADLRAAASSQAA